MKRAIQALLPTALALLATTPTALAHGGNPNYRSVVDEVRPNVPGVTFDVLDYDAEMQLLDRGGHEVTIYGYEGEPYARVLADGTVQVNRLSPATYLNDTRFATTRVPPFADPGAPPRWKTVDDSGTFTWHDHRMHYMSTAVPKQVTDEGRKTKVFDYEVPVRIDGRKGAVEGTLFWVGSPDTSKLPFIIVGAIVVLGGGVLVLGVRRRRPDDVGRAPEGDAKEAW